VFRIDGACSAAHGLRGSGHPNRVQLYGEGTVNHFVS
jgi:hypothetical protein